MNPFQTLGVPVTKFRPLNGYVLCRRDEARHELNGILLIKTKDSNRRLNLSTATIIKTGGLAFMRDKPAKRPGDRPKVSGVRQQLTVKEGDRVVLDKLAGHDIMADGIAYVLCTETDIMAILGEDAVAEAA